MNFESLSGMDNSKRDKIIIYSAAGALGVIVLGIILSLILSDIRLLSNFFIIAIFAGILPFFILKYLRFLELKDCERHLPVFLNDLKEAKKSGVSFPDAIKSCRGEYGKLNKYVSKLRKDLSWGIGIGDSLKHMRESLKDSKLISRSLTILQETYYSGGNLEGILDTLVSSLLSVMESERYRKSIVQQHLYMMYGIFLMYIFLVIILGSFMLPIISEMSSTTYTLGEFSLMNVQSPCDPNTCVDRTCIALCNYYNFIGSIFGFGEPYSVMLYYKSLFFTMIILQGFFTGIIAGQVSSRSWLDGLKHGMTMVGVGIFIVLFTTYIGLF
jgi:flagellar protein FlaJ